jgi:hypothetical protein
MENRRVVPLEQEWGENPIYLVSMSNTPGKSDRIPHGVCIEK